LISFAAKRISDYTQLTWTTVNENNVDHFVVERSDDGVHFYFIGQLQARNSGNTEVYNSKDLNPIDHIAYYRLKCVDVDTHFKYSKTVSVKEDNMGYLVLVTNPVNDRLILSAGNHLRGKFDYHINSIHGQILQEGKINIENSGQQEIILSADLLPGYYILHVSNDSQNFTIKFIKQ
jgi:hypothetical protein